MSQAHERLVAILCESCGLCHDDDAYFSSVEECAARELDLRWQHLTVAKSLLNDARVAMLYGYSRQMGEVADRIESALKTAPDRSFPG